MKHSYRDKKTGRYAKYTKYNVRDANGRFTKLHVCAQKNRDGEAPLITPEQIAESEEIMSIPELPTDTVKPTEANDNVISNLPPDKLSNVLSPIKFTAIQSQRPSLGDAVQKYNELDLAERRKRLYNDPGREYDFDPKDFFEGEPHNGDPTFLHIKKCEEYRLRICGEFLGFTRIFNSDTLKGYNGPEKKARRYLVNVYDHSDGQYKILECPLEAMRSLHAELKTIAGEALARKQKADEAKKASEEVKPKGVEVFVKWLVQDVLKWKLRKKEPEVETPEVERENEYFDVAISRNNPRNPLETRTSVKRITVNEIG